MFQKINFHTKEARDLENYKGKAVIVHAVRPNHNGLGFQKFKYVGVVDPDLKNEISISLGFFILKVGKIHFNCDFVVKEKAKLNECFVMSVEDPETNKIIYENGTDLKFEGEEIPGTGKITGVEDHHLERFEGRPAILLNTFKRQNQNCMQLRVSDGLAYIGKVPEDFKLVETDFQPVNEEAEEETF